MKLKTGILVFLAILAIMVITCNRVSGTTQQSTVSETAVTQMDIITSTENYTKILEPSVPNNKDTPSEVILEVYKKILLNETGIYTSNNKITYLHDLNFSLFAALDMDGDGTPELVLHNTSNGDTLVLHYYNGTVYGKEYSYRAMRNLKTDGFFGWSNSASNSGLGKLWFSGAEQETMYLAEYGSLMEDIEMYRINGSPVSQNDFYAYTAIQDAKEDVVWYELTIENINNLDEGRK
jgi:hypothetical protein